ncbi:alpha/beta hydrolase [Pseudonocardia zijingensis]|uniref:Alpha/beta hydrolase n=1 Tax=Pseudonocardia zijingensis TaxID=153376 RepID=A0ABN1NB36_9PSEU
MAKPLGYRPLTLDLVVPKAAEPVPLVVHIYGGAFAVGSHKTNSLGAELVDRLLPQGIAVAAIQYRHSREASFPAQVHDVKAAVRWLRHHGEALGLDGSRFGAWGSSSGGYLATMLAVTADNPDLEGALGITDASSAVQAAVSWSAPVNIARMPPPPGESPFHALNIDPHDWFLGTRVAESPSIAMAASTSTYVSASSAPLHLAHGEQDTGIPIDQSEEITAAYDRAGATVVFERIPGAGHFFSDGDRDRLITLGLDFLLRHTNGR